MRFRVGVVLCLVALSTIVGCRDALRPSTEDNIAPETWITAAPMDTITLKNAQGQVIVPSPTSGPTTIPVRFHVHWAGADQDGAVAGFFWAVVETLPKPPEGFTEIPELPGPKPQDYRFTTRTDSTFIFTVAEGVPDRQHAFFIYAVDNKGRPDPTPARFIFVARDRFPPIPYIVATATGLIYQIDTSTGQISTRVETKLITDTDRPFTIPRDTVAANSTLNFQLSAVPRIAGSVITGLKYKLETPSYIDIVPVPNPAQATVVFNSGIGADTLPPSPGTKVFTFRAVDQAFGSEDSTRRFVLNYSPISWWSGPDLNHPAWLVKPTGEKYLPLATVMASGVPSSLLGPDSTQILPALRTQRRTFLEFYNDTIYARAEGDTVHMNSIVILHSGGFDQDSPYAVRVSALGASLPYFPGGPVLTASFRPNASPVGFRSQMSIDNTTDSPFPITTSFAESPLYPVYDPNDPSELARIGAYWPVFNAGKAYIVGRAVDGDGAKDRRILDGAAARAIVTAVEGGTATPAQLDLRDEIMVFYIDKTPFFLTHVAGFTPLPGHVFTDLNWSLVLPAADRDPYVRTLNTPKGNPSPVTTLRRRVKLFYTEAGTGLQKEYTDDINYLNESFNFLITAAVAPGPCTLRIELCDCATCETSPGEGRCRVWDVPVIYAGPAPSLTTSTDRPGTN